MATRKALIVGIDYYRDLSNLHGCVNDATAVRDALVRHEDGSPNFVTPEMLFGPDKDNPVTRRQLKDSVRELFDDDVDIALFYFAGHGFVEETGGFLCTSDSESGDDGLSLAEVMTLANDSTAKNRFVILDSCHGGVAGDDAMKEGLAEISTGVTVLTASTATQYAMEENGSGVFTGLLIDALNGAAANLVGDVTPGGVYAHIDQSLGPWSQRPVFKANVKQFVSLRETEPPVSRKQLRALTSYFPKPGHKLALDPSYEPERSSDEEADESIPPPDPANVATFRTLQSYARVNLVRPDGAPHMWHAAMGSKACVLTPLGRHYWALVDQQLI